MKFFNKGKALYEKGEYLKSALEFKNAIQIDPKFADAYYMLGQVELHKSNPRGAYGHFLKAAELNPKHMKAHIEIGKLFFQSPPAGHGSGKSGVCSENRAGK